jgi:hypothetical protein
MLRRASERRVLPDQSPQRPPREELAPDQRASSSQPRSPTQALGPHHQQGVPAFNQQRMMGDMSMFPGGGQAQPPQWYDPSMDQYGGDLEMHAWATMELNTGAVAINGMEAYMIPVG